MHTYLNITETTIYTLLMSHKNSIVTFAQLQEVVNTHEDELESIIEALNLKVDMEIEHMPFVGFMLKTIR